MTREEKEPRLGVNEMLAIINRAPDLFKAFELNDRSWIGRDVEPWSFDTNQKSQLDNEC